MSVAVFQVNQPSKHYLIVVGLGLLGSRIAHHAINSFTPLTLSLKPLIDWSEPRWLVIEIENALQNYHVEKLDIVWAAGKAGFFASEMEVKQETEFFERVVAEIQGRYSRLNVSLMSSAGGLYESSGVVCDINSITPSRPYSFSKLRQEEFLRELGAIARVFRISSVYGYGGLNSRLGLIAAMVFSARSGKTVHVYGDQNTFRDYVYHDDIAKHIIEHAKRESGSCIEILASGRATSITMLQNLVASITGRKIHATYSHFTENTSDIVFSNTVIADSFRAISLEEGIRLLNRSITSRS